MLFGNREKLLEVLKNNPDILKSISKEFQNDPEFLKAAGIINSELENGTFRSDSFTSNAGEMIDYTSSEYESVIKLINDMKKIHFDIVNSISLVNDVALNDDDFEKITHRVDEDIKKLEDIKFQTDDLISNIISSIVIGTRLSLKGKNLSREYDSSKNVLIDDGQYILGKTIDGDYYVSINEKMNDNVSTVKSEVISKRPELSMDDINIDNGEIISSFGYRIILNGYVNEKNKEKQDAVEIPDLNISNFESEQDGLNSKKPDLNLEKKDSDLDKADFGLEKSIVNTEFPTSFDDLKIFDISKGNDETLKSSDSGKEYKNTIDSHDEKLDVITPMVFDSSPLEENDDKTYNLGHSFETGDVAVSNISTDTDVMTESNNEKKDDSIFDIKPNYEINSQFVFGKKDNVYYLVISPDINSNDIYDIKLRIAESMPELAGSKFMIDYGSIAMDNNFETLLTGFVKNESIQNTNDLSNNKSR